MVKKIQKNEVSIGLVALNKKLFKIVFCEVPFAFIMSFAYYSLLSYIIVHICCNEKEGVPHNQYIRISHTNIC